MKPFRNSNFVILIMGPPGAGKGTQAELLSKKLKLYHLETSEILEEKFEKNLKKSITIDGKRYSFSKEKKLWEEGKLCDPPFVTYLVIEKIKELEKARKNLVFSGSPRTVYEAKKIIPVLGKLYGKKDIKVFFLEILPRESIFRNSHRRICEIFRHPILYMEENKKLKRCPLDGSKLVRRGKLDKPETIKARLKEYKERTYPVIEYLKKMKIEIKKINGSPPPAVVFRNILKELK